VFLVVLPPILGPDPDPIPAAIPTPALVVAEVQHSGGNNNQKTRTRSINKLWKNKLKGELTVKNMSHSHIFQNQQNLPPTQNHQIHLQNLWKRA
jgi:hypothetical protein